MPGLELRLALPGHEQERDPPMVRHEGVRQPSQGADVLRPPPALAEATMSEDASIMLRGIEIPAALLFLGTLSFRPKWMR